MTDGIDKYLEALKAGHTEEQAKLFARSWAESMDLYPHAATKEDLKNAIQNLQIEMLAHFRTVYALGAAIFAAVCLPMLTQLFRDG